MPGFAAALALAAAAAAPAVSLHPFDPVIGRWENPRHTIEVQTERCGALLCGHIVRASPEAVADAKDSGIDRLIGLELLQDYRPLADGAYSGRVYVPDMGHSFSSRITPSGDALKISGCLVGNFFCKSQVWTRR